MNHGNEKKIVGRLDAGRIGSRKKIDHETD
jgi:hypothetical protein